MPNGVRVEYDVPATMRDGTVLRANVYRPDGAADGADTDATYPVLLTRLPYGKDLPLGSSALDPAQAARRGYIVVVQDVRGTFTSGGDWFPLAHEGNDGVDTVAWASSLPGSNGQVAMYGASYFGYTQWAAATNGATALRALAPFITWANGDEGALRNGVLELGLQASWLMQQGLDQMGRRYRGDLPALGRAMYGLTQAFDGLPEGGYMPLPLEHFAPLAALGLDEPMNATIRARDQGETPPVSQAAPDYARIPLPALHVGGWYDVFLKGTIANFQGMQAAGHSGQHLVIGPWTHGRFDPVIGDVNFGFASSGFLLDLRIDLMTMQLQFFDHWLKQAPNGFEQQQPAVKYFVMGANVWKSSDVWPPANATERRWYLHSQGAANTSNGDGALSPDAPTADEPADQYTYDPAWPVPTLGGATLMHPFFRAGPRDQRPIEARSDMLVYTSAPLEQPLEVTGPVSVTLYVASDAPDTDFVARLVDVRPDGTAIPLTDGIARMSYREGVGTPVPPLEPGRAYPVTIDLWATSNVFLPGHRVRLDVTSSSFPRWERNLNTGQSSAQTTEARAAQQTVLHDAGHASYVSLGVVEQG